MLGNNTFLCIRLTERCPLSCRYCYMESGPSAGKDFDLECFRRVVAAGRRLGFSWVSLSGGDPLAHPQFLEALDVVEKSGLWLFLETGGRLLTEEIADRLGRFARRRRCIAFVSLDSDDPENHDRMRGKGAHAAAVQAVCMLKTRGLTVHTCKVLSAGDLEKGFNLDAYLEFCKGLGVNRVEVTRVVPLGRGLRDGLRPTQEEIEEARRYLVTRDDYGPFVYSLDFSRLREVHRCDRLSGENTGLVVNPGRVTPCPSLPEIVLGLPEELSSIVASQVQEKLEHARRAATVGVDPDTIWGCQECRPALLRVLRELGGLLAPESARTSSLRTPVSAVRDKTGSRASRTLGSASK
jgi:MoaA/NifB/PqqE/SkfB family radical SAM enzyme